MADPEISQGESLESGPDSLTGILADVSVPFDLRKPEEKPVDYPPVFMERVERNWSKVCELMNWKTEGQAIDLSIFKLAKDPTQVVRSIQAAIVNRGGKLEKYGQDGKFGPETENGLKQALAQTSTLSATSPTESPLEPISRAPESLRERPQLTMRSFEALIDVFKASDERLKVAGLDIKGIDKTPVTPDVISAYKVKARAFRESLGRENPLLGKLCPIADEMIQVIEEEIKKIDISSVKNRQDFNDTIRDLVQSMEAKMEGLESQFLQVVTVAEKAQLEQMVKDGLEFKNLDQLELPMAFLMSAMNELALTAMEHFGKDPDAVENFVELMRIERMIPRKPMPRRVRAEDTLLTQAEVWMELVEHGPYEKKDGRFYFPHELPDGKEMSVSFDWDGMIQINNHRGLLKLPIGASISKIQALGNGNIQVTGTVSGFEQSIEITKAELDTFLTDLGTGKPGPLYLAGLEVDVSEREYSWNGVVEHGPYHNRDYKKDKDNSSYMLYDHELPDMKTISVGFSALSSDFSIGGHKADLRLPVGAELTSVQALPNGDMEFMWSLEGVEKNTTVSKLELDTFIKDVDAGKPGPFQLAGLRVVLAPSRMDFSHDEYAWNRLVEHGPYKDSDTNDFINFTQHRPNNHEPIDISFNITLSMFTIGHFGLHRFVGAYLRLPMGAEVKSVKALTNGDMEFVSSLDGVEKQMIVSKSELDALIKDVLADKPGPFQLGEAEVILQSQRRDNVQA